jgi:hypothetical protein
VKGDFVSRLNTGPRTIAFDPWTAIFGRWIDARISQEPITRSLLRVLDGNQMTISRKNGGAGNWMARASTRARRDTGRDEAF